MATVYAGGEGEGAGVKHVLREVVSVGMCRHAEVAKHGIGFPLAQVLDDVRVDAGAQEGGGPARAEASGADEEGVNAGEVLDVDGGVAQGVGDERWSGLSG